MGGAKGEIRGNRIEEASYVRRKGSRQQSERGEDVEEETGGPRGGINETIDLSIQHTSAVLSLSSLIYLHHQHVMDFLAVTPLHLHECGRDGWMDGSQRKRRGVE